MRRNDADDAHEVKSNYAENGYVTLKVCDVLGREVATLVNEQKAAGTYNVEWSSKGCASGVYFYRLQVTPGQNGAASRTARYLETKKMVVMK